MTNLGHRRKHSEKEKFALQLSELHEKEEKERSGLRLRVDPEKRSISSDGEHVLQLDDSSSRTTKTVSLCSCLSLLFFSSITPQPQQCLL